MPQHNDWIRQAIIHTDYAIRYVKDGSGLDLIGHELEAQLYALENHKNTEEFKGMDNTYYWNVFAESVKMNNSGMSGILSRLNHQRDYLYGYIGEFPPINDPAQLEINFESGK